MCGIVGVAGDISVKHEKVFKSLLFFDVLRGEDSTGIISVNKQNKTSWYKKALPAYEFMATRRFDKILKDSHKVLIGHNRAATKGHVSDENAHPFQYESITAVHNGTLRGVSLLDEGSHFDVDSEALIYNMALHGIEEVYSNRLHGAAALVWWDASDETLNFIRNDERPLYYAYSDDSKQLYWSSEWQILNLALSRADMKVHKNKFNSVKPHHLYKFTIPSKINEKIDKAKVKKLSPYVAPKPKTTTYNSGGYHGYSGNQYRSGRKYQGFGPGDSCYFKVTGRVGDTFTGHAIGTNPPVPVRISCRAHVQCDTEQIPKLAAGLANDLYYTGRVQYLDWTKSTAADQKATLVVTPYSVKDSEIPQEKKQLPLLQNNSQLIPYGSMLIPADEWREMVTSGCFVCNQIPKEDQAKDIIWMDATSFVCSDECEIKSYQGGA